MKQQGVYKARGTSNCQKFGRCFKNCKIADLYADDLHEAVLNTFMKEIIKDVT